MSKKSSIVPSAIFVMALLGFLVFSCVVRKEVEEVTLERVYHFLETREFVDLTHSFDPAIPHWPGFPPSKRDTLYWYEEGVGSKGAGFFAEYFSHVGQWGTHCDPPSHFARGRRSIDEISLKEMILPLVIIDVHDEVAENPDFVLTAQHIQDWERRNGPVPEGAFVAMRTDWSKRWPDSDLMANRDADGIAHYPGWSLDGLTYLYEVRRVTASGHETTDTDPGLSTSVGNYECETYILGQDHYQIELLARLDKVPERGALAVVTFPKPEGGSGFPARVFAILP